MCDDAGLQIASPPPRTPDGYTLGEMELRVKRARIGVITSAGVLVVGTVLGAAGAEAFDDVVMGTAVALVLSGLVGLVTSGGILAHRKRKLRKQKRELRESLYMRYGAPRGAQWNLARSRLVF
jgi:O-antigen/teichoic acid export membrane protein